MIKKISRELWMAEWKLPSTKDIPLLALCELPFSVSELELRFDLDFYLHEEDGIGECCSQPIEIDGLFYWLQSMTPKDRTDFPLMSNIKFTQTHPYVYIDKLCEALEIGKLDLGWVFDINDMVRPLTDDVAKQYPAMD